MNPTLATLRMAFRRKYNALWIKTDRMFHKDLKCLWIVMFGLLIDISGRLKGNSQIPALTEPLDDLIFTVTSSLRTLDELKGKLEGSRKTEARQLMIDKVVNYRNVIEIADSKLMELENLSHAGRMSKADVKKLTDEIGELILTDNRVMEILTAPFMKKSFMQMDKIPFFIHAPVNGKQI